jgi:hypothetical protein
MTRAQWLQEAVVARGLPGYPRLSAVGFEDLLTNGAAPTFACMESHVMSAHGVTVAPGPFASDSFTLPTPY